MIDCFCLWLYTESVRIASFLFNNLGDVLVSGFKWVVVIPVGRAA